jgi:hypothetical protein
VCDACDARDVTSLISCVGLFEQEGCSYRRRSWESEKDVFESAPMKLQVGTAKFISLCSLHSSSPKALTWLICMTSYDEPSGHVTLTWRS